MIEEEDDEEAEAEVEDDTDSNDEELETDVVESSLDEASFSRPTSNLQAGLFLEFIVSSCVSASRFGEQSHGWRIAIVERVTTSDVLV